MPDVVPAQRALFDIPHEVAYFNCACKSPLSHRVVAAGEEGVRPKARPWSIEPADCFTDAEVARARVAARIPRLDHHRMRRAEITQIHMLARSDT